MSILFFIISFHACINASPNVKPNILFILADDLGWGNVGWHQPNNTEIITPYMNKLAMNEGLILNRHYVHYLCCPTRSSFQSGRLPCHVVQETKLSMCDSGMPENMTGIGYKMKEAGFQTHIVGKWDTGWETMNKIPTAKLRGYDTSYVYLEAANDYFTQRGADNCLNNYNISNITDLWSNGKPMMDVNESIYEEYLFMDRINYLIDNNFTGNGNDGSEIDPFFLVYTPHLVHAPQQIPKEYLMEYGNDESECSNLDTYVYPGYNNSNGNGVNYKCRSIYESMVTMLDSIVYNITTKLKETGLWDNTLVIFSTDNGGPLQLPCCSGNNYPLRGGKATPWEGGIRGTAFITGGYLPNNRRGSIENGIIHISDWYVTFCEIFGVNKTDIIGNKHGLPSVDGYNVFDLIMGINSTSPHENIPLPIDETTLILVLVIWISWNQ